MWPFRWKLWKHFLSNHCVEEPSLIIWYTSLNTLQEHVLLMSHFPFFAEFAGAGFLSLFPDGLLFGNNHILLQLTKVALNYSIFQWSRIKNLKLVKWKFNKVNCVKLSSLGQSAVKLTSAGSHGNVVGCHNQDHWVFFGGVSWRLCWCGAVYSSCFGVFPPPHPTLYVPLPLSHQCDGCLE